MRHGMRLQGLELEGVDIHRARPMGTLQIDTAIIAARMVTRAPIPQYLSDQDISADKRFQCSL